MKENEKWWGTDEWGRKRLYLIAGLTDHWITALRTDNGNAYHFHRTNGRMTWEQARTMTGKPA